MQHDSRRRVNKGASRLKPPVTAASASASGSESIRLGPLNFSISSELQFVRIIVSGRAGGEFSVFNFASFLCTLEMVVGK